MSVLGIVGSIAGGLFGSSSAKDAARAQERAAQAQLQLESQIYQDTVERMDPFYQSGLNGQNALAYELGLGPKPVFGGELPDIIEFTDTPAANVPTFGGFRGRNTGAVDYIEGRIPQPESVTRFRVGDQVFNTREAAQAYAEANRTGGTEYQGFQATPGYQFQLDQGLGAIDNSAASRGNLFSGSTLKAAQTFGQGLANQEYNNYLNRLSGQSAQGQSAAANQANAGANFASGAGQANANIGNAGAAGAIGSYNALAGGLNNAIGIANYMNQQQPSFNGAATNPAPNFWNSLF